MGPDPIVTLTGFTPRSQNCVGRFVLPVDRPTTTRTNDRYGLGTITRVTWRGFVLPPIVFAFAAG
jgi:hypothetical protein